MKNIKNIKKIKKIISVALMISILGGCSSEKTIVLENDVSRKTQVEAQNSGKDKVGKMKLDIENVSVEVENIDKVKSEVKFAGDDYFFYGTVVNDGVYGTIVEEATENVLLDGEGKHKVFKLKDDFSIEPVDVKKEGLIGDNYELAAGLSIPVIGKIPGEENEKEAYERELNLKGKSEVFMAKDKEYISIDVSERMIVFKKNELGELTAKIKSVDLRDEIGKEIPSGYSQEYEIIGTDDSAVYITREIKNQLRTYKEKITTEDNYIEMYRYDLHNEEIECLWSTQGEGIYRDVYVVGDVILYEDYEIGDRNKKKVKREFFKIEGNKIKSIYNDSSIDKKEYGLGIVELLQLDSGEIILCETRINFDFEEVFTGRTYLYNLK